MTADAGGLSRIHVEGLVVVHDRQHIWLLWLKIMARQALEVIAAQIEIAAVSLPGEISGRSHLAVIVGRDGLVRNPIVVDVPLVRQQREIPAVLPEIAQVEFAYTFE